MCPKILVFFCIKVTWNGKKSSEFNLEEISKDDLFVEMRTWLQGKGYEQNWSQFFIIL